MRASMSTAPRLIAVYPEYGHGLCGAGGFSHPDLPSGFHRTGGCVLRVPTSLDERQRGRPAARHPGPVGPVGLSMVHLLGRDGNVGGVRSEEMADGTPPAGIEPHL